MRQLPETGPLLLPTALDILVPAIHGLIGSAIRLALLVAVLLVPVWLFGGKEAPIRALPGQGRFYSHTASEDPGDGLTAADGTEDGFQSANALDRD